MTRRIEKFETEVIELNILHDHLYYTWSFDAETTIDKIVSTGDIDSVVCSSIRIANIEYLIFEEIPIKCLEKLILQYSIPIGSCFMVRFSGHGKICIKVYGTKCFND